MIFIAIDPGTGGAAAAKIDNEIRVFKCPDTVQGMADAVRAIRALGECRAVIEKVHSMPAQGVTSTFTFGENFGTWLGILAALSIPVAEIAPQRWMKLIGTMPKELKERKRRIRDFAEKTIGRPVALYAADAAALLVLAPEIWGKR